MLLHKGSHKTKQLSAPQQANCWTDALKRFLLHEIVFAGQWKAPKYVYCEVPNNPLKSISTKWGNVAFCCIAVALQCDPACRSRWMDTMSFYLVPKGPAQQFFSQPVVKNMAMEWWWLHPYPWRSPASTSLPCTAPSLPSWPDRAPSTVNFMNHALWTLTVQHCCALWLALLR